MAGCSQCVRLRLAVPEAIHQVARVSGLALSGPIVGNLAEGLATPEAVASLRAHGLVRSVEVLPQRMTPEPLEPLTASLGTGLMQLLAEVAPKLVGILLGLAALRALQKE